MKEQKQIQFNNTLKFKTLIVPFLLGLILLSCDKNDPEINQLGIGQVEIKAYPENTKTKYIGFYVQAKKVIIDWGDGTIEELIPHGTYFDLFGHSYSDTLLKTVQITTENMTYFSMHEGYQLKFGNCPDLKEIYCPASYNTRNRFKFLDITKLESLEKLYCFDNQLEELDLSKNTMLTWLECRQNNLKKIDVSKNTALVHLDCGNNQLTNLDVSHNTALKLLSCNDNKINQLDLTKNKKIEELNCSNNQISNLDLSQNTALFGLGVWKNNLTNLNVRNNQLIKYLTCDNNRLTSLDLSENHELVELYCSYNQLTAQELNSTFEVLPIIKDPAVEGALLIVGNIGANDCNKAIATKKFWTIIDK